VRLVKVAGGFDKPLLVTAPPGDASRVFVVEQTGRVIVLKNGRRLARPFLDISGLVSGGIEQGLLGLAFHPDYARNGRFFVDYTNRAGNTRVVEYHVSANRDRANPHPVRRILAVPQPYPNHNGGDIVFGPDGKLYIGLGDGGSEGDPLRTGQRLDTLLGKILRVDVDTSGGRPYTIPRDNPFVGRAGARPTIYVLGVRNPWRFSFDPANGDLWIGDVGQNRWEEVDRLPAGHIAGANLGWSVDEGTHAYNGGTPSVQPLVPPVAEYPHTDGCSVTGGFVSRGGAVPALRGRYVYSDWCSGRVWTMRAGPNPGDVREITSQLGVRLSQVTSFGEDARGRLYVTAGPTVYRFARSA